MADDMGLIGVCHEFAPCDCSYQTLADGGHACQGPQAPADPQAHYDAKQAQTDARTMAASGSVNRDVAPCGCTGLQIYDGGHVCGDPGTGDVIKPFPLRALEVER